MIHVNQLEKIYGKGDAATIALNKVSFQIQKGEFVAIKGKSGCGKSTLLSILGGITHPTNGDYIFNGSHITELNQNALARFRNESVGFVVQHFALIPRMTIYQNIELPLLYRKHVPKDRKDFILETMDKLEIRGHAAKLPSELSGGEKQRAAIARAIVGKPELLLADEPTGALDEQTGQEVFNLLKTLNQAGMTILLVTHDSDMAEQCDKILTMRDGEIIS